ncbi:hypothetical protein [Streptomyces sp. NPDC093109]|uniref:hypothetical protein n=1 Tax=Streptomyces sp. NPDC093109 TaxID=3154977 RepID=UPI00344CA4DC
MSDISQPQHNRTADEITADLMAPRVPGPLADLLDAIIAAADVPLPGLDPADERAYHRLLAFRLFAAGIAAQSAREFGLTDGPVNFLRKEIARNPVTYTLWEPPGDSPAEPGPAAPKETCGRCRKPFDPTDQRHDGQARASSTPWCRRCVANCHGGGADHVCVICDPDRYRPTR